jgi:hypothetical protein
MAQPPKSWGTLFCHPNSITPRPAINQHHTPAIRPTGISSGPNFSTFAQAIQNHRIFRGESGQYRRMFENTACFIRVVRMTRPCTVRTYIALSDEPNVGFLDFSAEAPCRDFFKYCSLLVECMRLRCRDCGMAFQCYFYLRNRGRDAMDGREKERARDRDWETGKEDSDSSKASESSGQIGAGRTRRLCGLARRLTNSWCRGVRWYRSLSSNGA